MTKHIALPLQDDKDKKRKRDDSDDDNELLQRKILRAMIALLEELDDGEDDGAEYALLSEVFVFAAINADIPIPKTYKQAVNDLVYGKMWKAAIDEEIQSL